MNEKSIFYNLCLVLDFSSAIFLQIPIKPGSYWDGNFGEDEFTVKSVGREWN